jgi:predicted transcriptional regulator
VQVRFCAVKNRAVSNRNCVAVMRGGEQRNENDQSVTQAVREDGHREPDSVGVSGRVCERKTKPAKRAIGEEPNRRASGRSPDNPPRVGD